MNDNQVHEIIEQCIKAHWPNWDFKGQELVVWMQELRKFDHEAAKQGINDLYAEWDSERYPKMPHILRAIRDYAKSRRQQGKLAKLYQIENEDGKPIWKPFWGNAAIPRQELEPEAERLCKEADRMFPGQKHIARWFREEDNADHGYYGPDARDRAFAAILDGPDCPTKVWLEKYLNRKDKAQRATPRQAAVAAMKAEPVPIGQIVDNIPF